MKRSWTDSIKEGATFTRKCDGTAWTVRAVMRNELVLLVNLRFAGAHRIATAKQFNETFQK